MSLEAPSIIPSGEEPIGVEPEPPRVQLGAVGWIRANLVSTWFNAVLTLVFGVFLAWVAYRALAFVFVNAEWEIVRRNLRLFMVGRFPADELWRPWASLYLAVAGLAFAAGAGGRLAAARAGEAGDDTGPDRGALLRRLWPLGLLIVVVMAFSETIAPVLLLLGAAVVAVGVGVAARRAPLTVARRWWLVAGLLLVAAVLVPIVGGGVGWEDWGGLQLTVFVTVVGILVAFPLGVLVALARRSTLPALRWMATSYIELFRGVPLVTLLIMSRFVLLFMFPTWLDPPGLLARAMIVIILFEGAYIAEVVRGGLQSVPKGQVEAAYAVGLSVVKTTRRVVLPQALRAVIPAMVGQFISLFKDTSLLSILGFFELVTVAGVVTAQPDFRAQGLDSITYAFIGFVYWVGCYTMSRESQRLERRLGVGER
ncbi:MAG: amino acid ABC transporter permease [Acidimicrobiales bacterium]